MIQHWKAYFSTSQPERCDYLCLVLTADPSTKLWSELTWINDPSSRVGWSQHVTVGHPELPGGRLPFRAPHRCLWRRLFDQCWDFALDLFVGGHQGTGVVFSISGFQCGFNELKLANYIIVDFLNLPIHLLVILFSLDIDHSVGRFFQTARWELLVSLVAGNVGHFLQVLMYGVSCTSFTYMLHGSKKTLTTWGCSMQDS